ncbi:hypothetical protein BCR32DRAFT_242634 [Anaeromyces robustus]|uniref:CBM21 domain-containing protein n=1 Tax=Anaeromyces robustus TaxID=1754192 RepID=A0A1Y1XF75_9FUNG|nr:hypothetical protein BCR32DRAFT_242634 [Anaeromyces robustus]|eukprot:ORX84395.1 hypothetical protein BCR32DRAFT_242634 [Anaeromyces robustus]
MYINKSKNIQISTQNSLNFYDSSLENSFIGSIDLFKLNNNFNTTLKNQIEKSITIDENLRRKDSAIELEDIKNSYSDSEFVEFEKSENSKRHHHENQQKVEFIVDDENCSSSDSEEESTDESILNENTDIFNIEIDQIKNKQKSTFISSFSSPYHHNLPTIKTNQKFGNYINNLKNSPTKYNGLDILKSILKKNKDTIYSKDETNVIINNNNNNSNSFSQGNVSSDLQQKGKKKKRVHFKDENEECPFKKFDCPSNITNLPIYIVDSQLEPFLEAKLIKLKGFPSKKKVNLPWNKNVILESVGLIDDEEQEHDILRLIIQVRNLAYEKSVKVHLTFDNWKTVEIKEAKYKSSMTSEENSFISSTTSFDNKCPINIDKFILDIDTNCDGESVCYLQFAIQYQVNYQEFWDNNNGNNYSLKVDRTVRIPAKEIKSHPYCEGPVVRYKLKPGYHYPLFKNKIKISEHPSADIPENTSTSTSTTTSSSSSPILSNDIFKIADDKEITTTTTNTNINTTTTTTISTNLTSSSSSSSISCIFNKNNEFDNSLNNNQLNDLEEMININNMENQQLKFEKDDLSFSSSPLSIEKNSIENNLIIRTSSPIFEEEKKGEEENENVNVNENENENETNIENENDIENNIENENENETNIENENDIENNIENENDIENENEDSDDSLLDNTFKLPKHENWFKEAPSCLQFCTSPKKLYHHSNNFKYLNHYQYYQHSISKSLFNSTLQDMTTLTEKKKAEEEKENKKKLNSKYSFSTHLPSSSSKYMSNNTYGNYQSLYHIYHHPPQQCTSTPSSTTTNSLSPSPSPLSSPSPSPSHTSTSNVNIIDILFYI